MHEAPTAPDAPSIADFIDAHRAEIFARWSQQVRRLPVAQSLSERRLIDHLPDVLHGIAELLRGHRGGGSNFPEIHAIDRLDDGFDLSLVAREYYLLREAIFALYLERHGEPPLEQWRQVVRAIDEAVLTSILRYSQARERTLIALDRMSEAALEASDLDTFLPRLLRVLAETTEAVDSAIIYLREGDRLVARASVGLEEDVEGGFSLPLGEGFVGRVAAERRPMAVGNAADSPLILSPAVKARKLRAYYGVPMIHGEEVTGVAAMGSRTAYEFSTTDKLLFRTMVQRASAMILQAQLVERTRRLLEQLTRTHQELGLSEQRFRLALQGSSTVVFEQDTQLRYRWIHNPSFGLTVAEILGKTDAELFPEGGGDGMIEFKKQLLADGVGRRGEIAVAASGEAPIHFQVELEPVRDPEGKLVGLIGAATDITARQRSEEELRRAASFRETFLGVVSHDLRNPLSVITTSAHLLSRADDLPDRLRRPVARIGSAADKMQAMISDLLDFTRGRLGGGIPVTPAPINLRHLARHTVEDLELTHPQRRIAFAAEGRFEGEWDADRLHQLLTNLITNALQYGDPQHPVEVLLEDRGETVAIRVINHGTPIPPELMPAIFEPFRRATEERPAGLGLGLFISNQIVLAHGGSLSVESAGSRTAFTAALPRRASAQK